MIEAVSCGCYQARRGVGRKGKEDETSFVFEYTLFAVLTELVFGLRMMDDVTSFIWVLQLG